MGTYRFTYAIPYAIVADAIEYDYCAQAAQEGAFFGVWTPPTKRPGAGRIRHGSDLSAMGYVPNLIPARRSPSSESGYSSTISPQYSFGGIILYAITEKRYRRYSRKIEEAKQSLSR
jgi:hypothetical protein